MANYGGYGQGAGYGAPPGQPAYGAPPGQPGYGAPPPGQPGYGAPPPGQPGYGAPPPGQPGYGQQPGYGAPRQPAYGGAPQGYGAPPGISPEVYNWFAAVDTDRSGQITAHELQQALTNSNWSHFNPETCRLMIGMFDRNQSGKIDLNEFQALWTYIQQWKGVFDQFDRDRSGNICAQELNTAFSQMGYRLSPQFTNMVVYRYDTHHRRSLTFDNFIQACVLLKSVTDTFRQKDAAQQGNIRVSYEEFMTMCILNKG